MILLLAAALRFHALAWDARFHPDEALFATFARRAAVNGDWLLRGPLDKPPLSIYASALSMTLVGVTHLPDGVLTLDVYAGEFAARLPNALASLCLVALVYALARRLYGRGRTPLLAMLLLALSPYAVAFSATVFTDGLMLLCIVLALRLASARRWLWAGLWLALGFGCKQQALYYLPLLALAGWGSRAGQGGGWRSAVFAAARLCLPLALGFALLLAWDAARAQPDGVWALAAAHNDPGRLLVRFDEIVPRLRVWAELGGWLVAYPPMTALLGALAAAALAARGARFPRSRSARADLLLAAYLLGYGLLHLVVAFNIYDRYLLPVLPLTALLVARGLDWVRENTRGWLVVPLRAAGLAAGVLLLAGAVEAASGRVPVGGDRGKHAGIDALAAYLGEQPVAAVIYDHWLGWELDYYLGAWSDKRRVYYPTPAALVQDALLLDERGTRYFPVPRHQPVQPWLDALRAAGISVSAAYDDGRFIVYALNFPPSGAAASTAGSSWPGRTKPCAG
ncbi:MAG: glycosyltransferase family 39 protein [Chloroflexi bacterium]|nr:glycosyltransferase family 39 protein [Chloroflexota bacterium]